MLSTSQRAVIFSFLTPSKLALPRLKTPIIPILSLSLSASDQARPAANRAWRPRRQQKAAGAGGERREGLDGGGVSKGGGGELERGGGGCSAARGRASARGRDLIEGDSCAAAIWIVAEGRVVFREGVELNQMTDLALVIRQCSKVVVRAQMLLVTNCARQFAASLGWNARTELGKHKAKWARRVEIPSL